MKNRTRLFRLEDRSMTTRWDSYTDDELLAEYNAVVAQLRIAGFHAAQKFEMWQPELAAVTIRSLERALAEHVVATP